ncbi:MAG TPA: hypothetical protein VFD05_00685 [Bacilli bacterium]|nr:hypothetical protein [Bacilli bacterium]
MKIKFAKVIRFISIPPFVISLLALILSLTKMITWLEALYAITFLGAISLLAYPFAALIDKNKETRRKTMRKMAFVFTFIGYTAGFIFSLLMPLSDVANLIFQAYFISAIFLLITNGIFKFKASGHMTSITGPLVILAFYLPTYVIIPCLIFYVLVYWASLILKRHTRLEMIFGTVIVFFAFFAVQLLV